MINRILDCRAEAVCWRAISGNRKDPSTSMAVAMRARSFRVSPSSFCIDVSKMFLKNFDLSIWESNGYFWIN